MLNSAIQRFLFFLPNVSRKEQLAAVAQRRGFLSVKTNLLADRSEVGLWRMIVSPACNATVLPNAIYQIVGKRPTARLFGSKVH